MLESDAAQVLPAPGKAHADEFTRVRFLPDYHRTCCLAGTLTSVHATVPRCTH